MTLFFELIQTAIGRRERLSTCPTDEQWQEIYDICQKQALIGIGWYAIERLPKEQRPHEELLFLWMGMAQKIVAMNEVVIEAAQKVSKKLHRNGFDCCILKGAGNVVNYNTNVNDDGSRTPLGMYRAAGDVDVWMIPREGQNVIEYAKQAAKERGEKKPKTNYMHTNLPKCKGIEVEAHFRPAYMNSPIFNHRTLKWQSENATKQMENECEFGFAIPTPEFNVAYQLNHVFRHFIKTGIGLRQLLDYYMVLKVFKAEQPKQDMMPLLKHLGLGKFAAATMYVLQKVFAMDNSLLLCLPDKKTGEVLLTEIMEAGNFGKHDERRLNTEGIIPLTLNILRHDIRILKAFPEEVITDPFFRIYHKFWQLLH